jgi:hypothetical protein
MIWFRIYILHAGITNLDTTDAPENAIKDQLGKQVSEPYSTEAYHHSSFTMHSTMLMSLLARPFSSTTLKSVIGD